MLGRAWLRTRLRWALRLVRGSDLALGYAAVVIVVAVALSLVSARSHQQIVLQCSTNLVNLRERPVWVLLASAFVVSNLAGLWQIPMLSSRQP